MISSAQNITKALFVWLHVQKRHPTALRRQISKSPLKWLLNTELPLSNLDFNSAQLRQTDVALECRGSSFLPFTAAVREHNGGSGSTCAEWWAVWLWSIRCADLSDPGSSDTADRSAILVLFSSFFLSHFSLSLSPDPHYPPPPSSSGVSSPSQCVLMLWITVARFVFHSESNKLVRYHETLRQFVVPWLTRWTVNPVVRDSWSRQGGDLSQFFGMNTYAGSPVPTPCSTARTRTVAHDKDRMSSPFTDRRPYGRSHGNTRQNTVVSKW